MSYAMTLGQLIEQLQDMQRELGDCADECPVLLAVQPSWPLAHTIEAVTAIQSEGAEPGAKTIWLAASSGHPYRISPYAPKAAWEGGVVEHSDDE